MAGTNARNFNVGGSCDSARMNSQSIADVAEQIVHDIALALVFPRARECLACYIDRQVRAFGCDGTYRFVGYFRDLCAPRATALETRLNAHGARCDDSIYVNCFIPVPAVWLAYRRALLAGTVTSGAWIGGLRPGEENGVTPGEESASCPTPPCLGVRRGSTQPCSVWSWSANTSRGFN